MYHASTRTAASVITSPTSRPVVGDDRRTREGYHAAMPFRRLAFALATAATASAALLAGAPQPQPAAPALPLRIIVSASREQAQRLLARVRNGEDFAA